MVSKNSLANLLNKDKKRSGNSERKYYLSSQLKGILARYAININDLAKVLNISLNRCIKRLNESYNRQGGGTIISLLESFGMLHSVDLEAFEYDKTTLDKIIFEKISEKPLIVNQYRDICDICKNERSKASVPCENCGSEATFDKVVYKRRIVEQIDRKTQIVKNEVIDDKYVLLSDDSSEIRAVKLQYEHIYDHICDETVILSDSELSSLQKLKNDAIILYNKKFARESSRLNNLERLARLYHSDVHKSMIDISAEKFEDLSDKEKVVYSKAERIKQYIDVIDSVKNLNSDEMLKAFRERIENIEGLDDRIKDELWELAITDSEQDRKLRAWMQGDNPKNFHAESAIYEMLKDHDGNLMITFDKHDNPIATSVLSRKTFCEEENEINRKVEEHSRKLAYLGRYAWDHFSLQDSTIERGYNEVDYIEKGLITYYVEMNYYAFLYFSKEAERFNLKHSEEIESGSQDPLLIKALYRKGKANLTEQQHSSYYELMSREGLAPLDQQKLKAIERLWLVKTNFPFKEMVKFKPIRVISSRFYKKRFAGYDKNLNPVFDGYIKNRLSESDRYDHPIFECSRNFELTKQADLDIDVQYEVQALYRDVQALTNASSYTDDEIKKESYKSISDRVKKRKNALRYASYFRPKLHIFDANIKFQKDDLVRAMNKYYSSINRSVKFSFKDTGSNLTGKSYIDSEQIEIHLDPVLDEMLKQAKKLHRYMRYNPESKRYYMHHSVSFKTLVKQALKFTRRKTAYESERDHLKMLQNRRYFNVEVIESILFNLWLKEGDKIGFKPIFRVEREPMSKYHKYYVESISILHGDCEVYSQKQEVIDRKIESQKARLEALEKYGTLLPFGQAFYPKLSLNATSDREATFGKELKGDLGIIPVIFEDIYNKLVDSDDYEELSRDREILRNQIYDIICSIHADNLTFPERDKRKFFTAIPRITKSIV